MPCFLAALLFLLISAQIVFAQALIEAREMRIAGDAARVRLLLHFDQKPEADWFLLRSPHRLVIDLPETRFLFPTDQASPRGLVGEVRYGQLGEGRSRVILSFSGPFAVEAIDVMANSEEAEGYRLVVDVVAADETSFEKALASQLARSRKAQAELASRGDRLAKGRPQADKRFTIVIDPGHGGIDGGAEGRNGTSEKVVTLAFGLELRNALVETGLFDVHMTREKDDFLRLDERVRYARQVGADLLLSIHADSIRLRDFRGATVYTLSEKASDPEAAATAIRENMADEQAGILIENETRQVTDILADLIRRETHAFSIQFARSLVGELSQTVEMVSNPLRSAGFRVLTAPDVPSVLLELGYLSNPEDEALLRDPEWRRKAVEHIVSAVRLFAEAKMAAGG
jgi:N-acetylmuramoyl-L-alanine amidase